MRCQNAVTSIGGWLGFFAATTSALETGFDVETFPHPALVPKPTFRDLCPVPCADVGPTGFSWTVVPSIAALKQCNETLLFEGNLNRPITSTARENIIRACSVPESSSNTALASEQKFGPPCLASAELRPTKVDVEVGWWPETVDGSKSSDIVDATLQLQKNIIEDPNCESTALFAKSGDAVVGLWVGEQIRKTSAKDLLERFVALVESKEGSLPKKAAAQVCGSSDGLPWSQSFGIYYDATGKISDAFSAVQGWSKMTCLDLPGGGETWKGEELSVIPGLALTLGADAVLPKHKNSSISVTASSVTKPTYSVTSLTLGPSASVEARAYDPYDDLNDGLEDRDEQCWTARIEATDSCYSLATQKCGITLEALYKYNGGDSSFCTNLAVGTSLCCSGGDKPEEETPSASSEVRRAAAECKYLVVAKDNTCPQLAADCGISTTKFYELNGGGSSAFCNNLKIRSAVCCTAGDKPNLKPKDNSDGSCAVYTIKKGDGCFDIADPNGLTVTELHNLNTGKTWGWGDCDLLKENMKICLSGGTPPMPAPIENAICGPQKPGTERPSSGNLTMLNPCPLNVCCNIWGQCGTTKDFCVDTTVNNTPGTAKKDTYGCISNCGMDIVNNKVGPDKFRQLGYFEGWNMDRPCLNMDVETIPKENDIIHFAFGMIAEDFSIYIGPKEKEQFDKFVKLKSSFKKVLSFGGWAFSNEPATSHIFRNAVKPANSLRFATNVINFIAANGLDGVDFDWEYPGATDIDGSQPGSPDDGKNYLAFLGIVKRRMPQGKTIAIAAPASYWYLKAFPIAEISKIVDYIVYMTYDLHGQWDVGNKWASEGCPGANCLRSHVNITLTQSALSMVTKAGVPTNKLMVGVSSYGRSFKMAQMGCEGPNCFFLGGRNQSPAKAGTCTGTPGYIADAEMMQIALNAQSGFGSSKVSAYHDDSSDSDIFIYDDVEWVSWMSPKTKDSRKLIYRLANMAGTSDWAIDLGVDVGRANAEKALDDWPELDLSSNCPLDSSYDTLDALDAVAGGMDPECAAMLAIDTLKKMLANSLNGYDAAASGYDGLFDFYKDYIIKSLDGRLERLMTFEKQYGGRSGDFFNCFAVQGGLRAKRSDAKPADCFNLPTGKPFDDYAYWFELKDEAGWHKALAEEGILTEWVQTGYKEHANNNGCTGQDMCIAKNIYYHDIPMPKAAKDIEVPDPKEIIRIARENMANITDAFDDIYTAIGFEDWSGGYDNAVEVLSVPVFMLEDAVASMNTVKEIGKDWKEEQEKNLILQIIEGVLFLLAFVGPVVGSLGRVGAALGRLIMAIEGAGAAGLGVYAIIEDPSSAPLAILLTIMGELGGPAGRSGRFAGLNAKKNEMSPKQKENMGKSYATNTPKVQSIMGKACGTK
ncbi:hypothetical protein VDGD_07000 [Verticillium dahliae]|nr:hypothetical protein VDGD_07000 [Verticillium dahliae]